MILEDDTGQVALEMRPNNDLISNNFHIMVREDNSIEEVSNIGHLGCVFVGHDKHHPGSSAAALSNCDGKGFVSMNFNKIEIFKMLFIF